MWEVLIWIHVSSSLRNKNHFLAKSLRGEICAPFHLLMGLLSDLQVLSESILYCTFEETLSFHTGQGKNEIVFLGMQLWWAK